MTLEQFIQSSDDVRCFLLLTKGEFIAGKQDKNHTYNLYSVYSFYFEVCYDVATNKIEKITAFTGFDNLDRYINDFKLKSLIRA